MLRLSSISKVVLEFGWWLAAPTHLSPTILWPRITCLVFLVLCKEICIRQFELFSRKRVPDLPALLWKTKVSNSTIVTLANIFFDNPCNSFDYDFVILFAMKRGNRILLWK